MVITKCRMWCECSCCGCGQFICKQLNLDARRQLGRPHTISSHTHTSTRPKRQMKDSHFGRRHMKNTREAKQKRNHCMRIAQFDRGSSLSVALIHLNAARIKFVVRHEIVLIDSFARLILLFLNHFQSSEDRIEN